jgi:hypothetical protein
MNLTPEEAAAIRKLCPDSDVARQVLGEVTVRMPADWYEPQGDPQTYAATRLRSYAGRLRGYLVTMAEEMEELPDDHARLSSEAVGILLALRDIEREFPEVFGGECDGLSFSS